MGTNTITGISGRSDGTTATWYGLVPNSVKRVIVSYASGHKTTVPVVDNTFLVHLRGPMQQCLTRRTAREALNLSTTARDVHGVLPRLAAAAAGTVAGCGTSHRGA